MAHRPLLSAAAVLAVLALGLGVAACGGSGDEAADTTSTEVTAGTATTGDAPTCADVDLPAFGEEGTAQAPTEPLDPEKTYELVFDTSCGTFVVTLDQGTSPNATASLVSLAKAGWFDDTIIHRVVPGFVIQGGDPTQSGTGGPGYSTRDDVPTDASYAKGVVAMAKGLQEPPGTAGSQFFIVTGEDVGLQSEYAVVGTVTQGLDVVEEIGRQGDVSTEQPTIPIVVESVTVEES